MNYIQNMFLFVIGLKHVYVSLCTEIIYKLMLTARE